PVVEDDGGLRRCPAPVPLAHSSVTSSQVGRPSMLSVSAMVPVASRASSKVETATTSSPSGTWPSTSSQFPLGARKYSAPVSRAPTICCRIPPMGPTAPSAAMVPVPAIACPPVSAPGVSSSQTHRAKIIPALGPPISPTELYTSLGNSQPLASRTPVLDSPPTAAAGNTIHLPSLARPTV